jgi:hypothetical protein
MQVVQTSFNAISQNASCFLIHMSSLELHNVDTFFFGSFMWPFSSNTSYASCIFVGLAYQEGKDIVFRFIIEYSSLRDFYGSLGNNNRSIFIWGFLKHDILACVETWD